MGEMIGEERGRRTGRRIISTSPNFKVEVSFEDQGKLLGLEASNIGTYTAEPRADGTLFGEGQGVILTPDGETATWKGVGTGRFTGGGAVAYRGSVIYSTTSKKLAQLNTFAGVFEFDIDADGNTHGKTWMWK